MKWHIGTSGWSYDSWKGAFYPDDLKTAERLPFYAKHFDTVEVNNTFYHLPSKEGIEAWEAAVPKHFIFAIKASRYITHRKKMKDADEHLPKLMKPLSAQTKGGPLIFQLPPRFHRNMERLESFLRVLPKERQCAMEFRDPDWHCEEVYDLLRQHNVAFCMFEKEDVLSPRVVTADFTYLRLHGRKAGYKGNYDRKTLKNWCGWHADNTKEAWIFFDNTDEKLYAVENALEMRDLAEGGEHRKAA